MKTLITGAFKLDDELMNTLINMGLEITYLQSEKDEIDFNDFEFVICNGLFLYHDIKKFHKLKYIQLTSAGLDRVPLEYITEKNITIFNARGVYSIPMAEWTLLKILELYKNSKKFIEQQKKHIWDKERNIYELYGKNIAIIGMGSVGIEIAQRLNCFGTNIYSVDKSIKKESFIYKSYLFEDLNKVLSVSDIVILTIPLNDETKHLFNKERFELMKKNSVLVNISRGKIIDTEALLEYIESHKFLGVILDVFEEEPLDIQSKLWDYENVIITPHNSFVGEYNDKRLFESIYRNIRSILDENKK